MSDNAFPYLSNPKVLWVGLNDNDGKMTLVYRELNNLLIPLKFNKEDKKYFPHITIARIKEINNQINFNSINENIPLTHEKFYLNEIKLIESKLTPKGPIYQTIKSFTLLNSNH